MSRVVFTAYNKNPHINHKDQDDKLKKMEATKVKNKLIEALDENDIVN